MVFVLKEMKQHPAFMTEFDESKPLTPALEALQILKYESPSNDGGFFLLKPIYI